MDPFLSIRDFNIVVDFCVEFLYLWVRKEREAENDDGDFSEVSYHVRDVTLRDVMLCGGVQDLAEQELIRAAEGR